MKKGTRHTAEARRKMSEAEKGENNPFYGKKHTEETLRKMSEARKGKPKSEETKRKMSLAKKGENNPFYGKNFTEEHKRNMSLARKGKPKSEETKRKMSEARKGKPKSEETKRKMSEARKGENNPMFNGWSSRLPYAPDWGLKVKLKVRMRDGYTCQNPECGRRRSKTVHHINYDKMNCDSTNLITLCGSCNARANYDRHEWQKFFEDILIMRNVD